MSNGWGLAARLISKHFGNLGDQVSETIAAHDPETATEVDREQLAGKLRDAARKLAQAKAEFDREHADVVTLQNLVASDTQVATTLSAKLADGSISEAQVNAFLDELEANKARLATEQQQEADAKNFADQLQQIVDTLSQQLAAFDEQAKAAKRMLATAEAQRDVQELRKAQQDTLSSLQGAANTSTALGALVKKAQSVQAEAEADRIVTDIGQRDAYKRADIDAIRKAAIQPQAESTADRLKRLAGGPL